MKQKKQETNDLIVSREAKGIGESHGKSTVEGIDASIYKLKLTQDEVIEILEKALSEVGSKGLTSTYKTEQGGKDLVKLSECLIHEQDKIIASKISKYKNLTDPKQIALREIEEKALKVKDQFKRHGYKAEFVKEMWDLYPILKDIKAIENRLLKLKKEGKIPGV